ncbi:MAG: hypothetical protein V4563_16825 [Pseudomonadota bacterium]
MPVGMASESNDYSFDPKSYIGLLEPYSAKFASAINERCSSWSKNVISNGQQRQWFTNYRLYYNADPNATGTTFNQDSFSASNEQGDVVRARYNLYRNFIVHILNMTVNQPPALDVKAANSEPSSLVAAQLYKDVLDFYVSHWKRGRFKKQLKKAVEYSLFMSNGYLLVEWDPTAGNPYVIDDQGGVVRDGDLYIKARSVWDVFFDCNCEDDDELDWVIVRDYVNRHELLARFKDDPDKVQAITNLPKKTDLEVYRSWGWDDNTDLVAVYKYYHRTTAAVPNGRYALCIDSKTVLYDGKNPYVDEFKQAVIPLLTMRAADGIGTLYGYSPGFDLAPLQMAFNTLWTAILTNHSAFGIQNLLVERGADLNVEQLQGSLNIVETNPGTKEPKALQLTAISPDSYKSAGLVEKLMESCSGINSVVRGDPDSALKAASGRALGLLQAMAVQYNSGPTESYQQMTQDAGNLMLLILRNFAKTERVTKIVGKDKVMRLSSWSGGTFSGVGAVVAEQVNPMSRTTAGTRDEAEFLVQNHLVSTPEQYMMVRDTGRMDPLTMTDTSQLNLIQLENDKMLNGGNPQALIDDEHDWHIKTHLGLVSAPDVRDNGEILGRVLTHVQHHRDLIAQKKMQDQGGAPPQPQPNHMPMAGPQLPQPGMPMQQPHPHMTAHRTQPPQSPMAPGPTGAPVPIPSTAQIPGSNVAPS